jgi:hypothetical protein
MGREGTFIFFVDYLKALPVLRPYSIRRMVDMNEWEESFVA